MTLWQYFGYVAYETRAWFYATLIVLALTTLLLGGAQLAWGEPKHMVWALPFKFEVGGHAIFTGQFQFGSREHCEFYALYLKQKHDLRRSPECRYVPRLAPEKAA